MPYSLRQLCSDCSAATAPTSFVVACSLPRSADTYKRVWDAFMTVVLASLKAGKGLRAPNFARFTFLRTNKKPLFVPCEPFTRSYGVSAPMPLPDLQVPCVDLNYARLASIAGGMDKDQARGMFETVLARLGQEMSKGTRMRIKFPGVGVLAAENRVMRFRFTLQRVEDSGKGAPPEYSARDMTALLGSKSMPALLTGRSVASLSVSSSRRLDIDPAVQNPLVGVETVAETASARQRKADELRQSYRQMLADKRASARRAAEQEREEHREQLQRHKAALAQEQAKRQSGQAAAKQLAADLRAQTEAKLERAKTAAHLDRSVDDANFLRLKSDEDVQQERRLANQALKEELDEQVAQKARSGRSGRSGRSHRHSHRHSHRSSSKRRESQAQRQKLEQSLGATKPRDKESVYPKFLVPCNEELLRGARMADSDQVTKNARMAFEALERQLKDQADRARKFEDEQAQAKRAGEDILRERAEAKRKKQMELNQFLIQQAEHKREQDRKERLQRFYDSNPDPSAAYPVEQRRDSGEVAREKAALKSALDAQVRVKQQRAAQAKMLEHQEDRFYLQCVHQQLQQDREFRRQKRNKDRSTLADAWNKQQEMNRHLKELALQSQ